MARMFVRHDVQDFTRWKQGYDEAAGLQREAGVTSESAYQSADDPNDVTVIHDFDSIDSARAFAASPELKEAMGQLGVIGKPQIWFTERA